MTRFTESIMTDMYLSNDGINNWGVPYGSFDSMYPLSIPMPKLEWSPPVEERTNYDYYITNYPLSMGLDPTPWAVMPGDIPYNYETSAWNKWFSNGIYVDGEFGLDSNALDVPSPSLQGNMNVGWTYDPTNRINVLEDLYMWSNNLF